MSRLALGVKYTSTNAKTNMSVSESCNGVGVPEHNIIIQEFARTNSHPHMHRATAVVIDVNNQNVAPERDIDLSLPRRCDPVLQRRIGLCNYSNSVVIDPRSPFAAGNGSSPAQFGGVVTSVSVLTVTCCVQRLAEIYVGPYIATSSKPLAGVAF